MFQNSSSGAKSSVDSVESTLRSVPAVPCYVRKEGRKEGRKKTKGESTRNSSREWASDCKARSHEHEDVGELHRDHSMKSVGFRNLLSSVSTLEERLRLGSKNLVGLAFFLRPRNECVPFSFIPIPRDIS